jgi:hypothetical protein
LAAVGGRSEAATLQLFSQALTKGPGTSVTAVLKRWNGLNLGTGGSRPTLGDAARLIGPLRSVLETGGKTGAVSDTGAVLNFLHERPTVPVAVLLELGEVSGPRSRAKKPTEPLRLPLIEEHAQRLRQALGDPGRFTSEFEALSELTVPEVVALAKKFSRSAARSRDGALKKIWAHHLAITGFEAKERATGGRSAA